jgi:hypothetical protein
MPIPNFQYSWPDKESRPESHTHDLFCHCLCVRYGHHSGNFLDEPVRSFFMLNTRAPIDIIQSSQSFKYATSVVWYASQTTAECLISRKPYFSFSGDVGAMTHLCSFSCTCTPKGSKWYSKIRLDGKIPRAQRHSNCCAGDYLDDCGARVMVLVESHSTL